MSKVLTLQPVSIGGVKYPAGELIETDSITAENLTRKGMVGPAKAPAQEPEIEARIPQVDNRDPKPKFKK